MKKKALGEKPRDSTRRFFLFLMFSTILMCVIGYSYFFIGRDGYPLFDFMKSKIGRFDDFYNSLYSDEDTLLKNKAGGTVWPGSVILYKILSFENINVALFIYLVTSSAIFFYGIGKLSNSFFIPMFALVSYPFSFSIARGNNEHLLVGITALGYYWLRKKKENKFFHFTFIQQLIEPYPVYLFQIFQFKKRFIKRQLGAITSFVLAVILLKHLEFPGKYFTNLISEGSGGVSTAWPGSTLHSSSISSLVQYVFFVKSGEFPYNVNTFLFFQKFVLPISLLICLIFAYRNRNRMDLQTLSLLLICVWTLFHSTSFDYRLLHFFIPISLFYYYGPKYHDKMIFILIALLLIPKPYAWIIAPNNSAGITLGSIVNPIILVVIIFLVVERVYRFKLPKEIATSSKKRNK